MMLRKGVKSSAPFSFWILDSGGLGGSAVSDSVTLFFWIARLTRKKLALFLKILLSRQAVQKRIESSMAMCYTIQNETGAHLPLEEKAYKPLIVQSDMTLLLETGNETYEVARDELSAFAEMVKSPEYVHTYKITPLSLWNAASVGMGAEEVIAALDRYSKYPVPEMVKVRIRQIGGRYGKVVIDKDGDGLFS